jgi:hypothetical protein
MLNENNIQIRIKYLLNKSNFVKEKSQLESNMKKS